MRKPISIAVRVEPMQAALARTESFEARLRRIAQPLQQLDAAQAAQQFALPAHGRLLKTTLSLCPQCLAHVVAAVYVDGVKVLIAKHCATHGASLALLENDARYYHLSNKDQWGRSYAPDRVVQTPAYSSGCCGPSGSCGSSAGNDVWPHDSSDQRSNKTCTVLIEITDACNLACRVCYADSKGDRILSMDAFRRHLGDLLALKGSLDSVQLIGGEPTLHPHFWEMLSFLHADVRVKKIYVATNGIALEKPGMAERLLPFRDKLLVLLQFDGLQPATNKALRQANPMRIRASLLKRLDQLHVPTQLTMTLARGVSEREIAWVVRQGVRHRNVRLVAMLPVFFSGRHELTNDPMDRITLSDVIKGVAAGLAGRSRTEDFLPIPCSHPNCGWVTLFARRLGFVLNIARHVDVDAVMNDVAYKTVLDQREMQGIIGSKRTSWVQRLGTRLGRKLVRPRDVFGVVIKPFMDRYTYDQDRISACCHHMLDTAGRLESFCEYNARHRPGDSWEQLPQLADRVPLAEVAQRELST
jgi:7,8-dihydro-6-hydroxymethylpterin dimethyltransferase